MELLSPKEAASLLFERHGDEIYRYVRFTIGNASQVDDILQEVFLRVMQSWARFNHTSSPKTWLWSITKNCIRDYYRNQKRINREVPLQDDVHDLSANGPLLKLQLEESIKSLPMMQREVFVERIIHQKSTEDAATTLGWSTAKVKTTLHRAMKQIKKSLR